MDDYPYAIEVTPQERKDIVTKLGLDHRIIVERKYVQPPLQHTYKSEKFSTRSDR